METLPFSVDIDASKIVDHLTDAMKTKIPDTYKGVDAKDLMLWRVSIPLVPKKDRKDISLGDVPSKEELDEKDDLFGVFPDKPPKIRSTSSSSIGLLIESNNSSSIQFQ
ncbi:hypothetical protein F5H01DRAFT_382016 [Linnemannia elongata]|nr:hypothetical protein F5H01DRAFT_382016 [Linnemannia elongata]